MGRVEAEERANAVDHAITAFAKELGIDTGKLPEGYALDRDFDVTFGHFSVQASKDLLSGKSVV